ncbi:hypothetical protein C8R46DRAFT_294118, partial [Mycena filopes]
LASAISSKESTARLYGPVHSNTGAVTVYIGTSTRKGRAAFALWWGPDSKRNCAYVTEGKGSDGSASALAVLCAARDAAPGASLLIYTCSQYAIRSFCYWAGDNETRGWSCANGDELRDAAEWLAARTGPTNFRWVESKSSNPAMIAAKRGAKEALALPVPITFSYAQPLLVEQEGEVIDMVKVSTALPEFSEPKAYDAPEIGVEEVIDTDVPHRGRRRERELLRENLLKFLAASDGPSSK